MVDDFDWDGDTLAIGDDEGLSLLLEMDPGHEQAGVNPPGTLAAITDYINFGVFNGNFRFGPPLPFLDASNSTSGSNFMPGWRFVRSSNSNITVSHVRDTASPSGSNLRFTFASGLADDAVYIEQMVDIGGSRTRQTGDFLRGTGLTVSGSGVALRLRSQYLTVDGAVTGMPAEKVSDEFGVGSSVSLVENAAADSTPPGNARFLRLRVEAYRTGGTGAAVIDLTEVRRARGFARFPVLDESTAPSYSIPWIGNSSGKPYVTSPRASDAEAYLLLGFKLVPIAFVLLNVPANTTTQMQPSDVALGLGTPRVRIPWPGHIVGMSYRLSTGISAGTLNFQATVGGSNVWSPWGALTSAASQHDATSQGLGSDLFTASDALGIQVVTSAAFAPTTMDIHAILWVALEWDGL